MAKINKIGYKTITKLTKRFSQNVLFRKIPKPYGPLHLNDRYIWDGSNEEWIIMTFPLNLNQTFQALLDFIPYSSTPLDFIHNQINILENSSNKSKKFYRFKKMHKYFFNRR